MHKIIDWLFYLTLISVVGITVYLYLLGISLITITVK